MNSHQMILLIFIGYIVFAIDKRKENFPVPMVLLLLGIGLSFIPYLAGIQVTKELIFNWFLPALLFISAYQLPVRNFKRNLGLITFLGTIGITLTSFLLGISIYYISHYFVSLTFLESLLLAIILTPTDPTSVVPTLQKSSEPSKIADVVEGESLLNDGTSLVLFSMITMLMFTNKSFSTLTFITEFFYVFLGGVMIGTIFGWFILKGLHLTKHIQYQVMVSITLAYGSFYIAEYLHVSGVLATVSSGILFSFELGRSGKEKELRESIDVFWKVVEPTILSIIFLLIGIQATQHLAFNHWGFAILIFVLTLFIRFIVLMSILKPIPKWRNDYSMNDLSLLTSSGIKGTMSIVIILTLKANYDHYENILISLSFSVIILSMVIQSSMIYPLSKSGDKGTGTVSQNGNSEKVTNQNA